MSFCLHQWMVCQVRVCLSTVEHPEYKTTCATATQSPPEGLLHTEKCIEGTRWTLEVSFLNLFIVAAKYYVLLLTTNVCVAITDVGAEEEGAGKGIREAGEENQGDEGCRCHQEAGCELAFLSYLLCFFPILSSSLFLHSLLMTFYISVCSSDNVLPSRIPFCWMTRAAGSSVLVHALHATITSFPSLFSFISSLFLLIHLNISFPTTPCPPFRSYPLYSGGLAFS